MNADEARRDNVQMCLKLDDFQQAFLAVVRKTAEVETKLLAHKLGRIEGRVHYLEADLKEERRRTACLRKQVLDLKGEVE